MDKNEIRAGDNPFGALAAWLAAYHWRSSAERHEVDRLVTEAAAWIAGEDTCER